MAWITINDIFFGAEHGGTWLDKTDYPAAPARNWLSDLTDMIILISGIAVRQDWNCLVNVNSIPFPPRFFMKTLTSSSADHHERHRQHISHSVAALYHVIWRQPSLKKPSLDIMIFWKTTVPVLTFHFCPKSLKKSFSANFFPISKKTTSAIPFSQPIELDTALRLFCYLLR